jgi:hypothetical protein
VQYQLDRIGAERHTAEAECTGHEMQRGNETYGEDDGLDDPAQLPVQKFLRRSRPLYRLATWSA